MGSVEVNAFFTHLAAEGGSVPWSGVNPEVCDLI